MPNRNAHSDEFNNWRGLLANVEANETSLHDDLRWLRDPLAEVLVEAEALDADLKSRVADKQELVRQRRALMAKGRELASRLRAALKADLGIHNEKLIQYGARPVRNRPRPAEATGEPQPNPAPTTPPTTETTEPTETTQ